MRPFGRRNAWRQIRRGQHFYMIGQAAGAPACETCFKAPVVYAIVRNAPLDLRQHRLDRARIAGLRELDDGAVRLARQEKRFLPLRVQLLLVVVLLKFVLPKQERIPYR